MTRLEQLAEIVETAEWMRARGVAQRDELYCKVADSLLKLANLSTGTQYHFNDAGEVMDFRMHPALTTEEAKANGAPY